MRRLALLAAPVWLTACTPAGDTTQNAAATGMEAAATGGQAGEAGAATDGDGDASGLDSEDVPGDFARTAWRIEDEDGARYTTYLDDAGAYRDVRNGDPWHAGSWEVDDGGSLCLTPEAESGRAAAPRQCWNPQGMDGDGGMIVQASSGKRIRLQQVDYRAPQGRGDEGSSGDEAASETAPPA